MLNYTSFIIIAYKFCVIQPSKASVIELAKTTNMTELNVNLTKKERRRRKKISIPLNEYINEM